ncbi:MAG: tetratricopeptide repeat protein, partial [Planctomycetaceae bacterium]
MPHPPDQPVGIFPPAGPSQPGDTPSAGKSNKSDATDHSHRQSSAKRKTVHPRLLESTLNTRFLFITVLLALGFAGVVILTHRLQIDHLTDALLTRAKAAAEKEPKRAQRWYRDYLKLRKDDLDARTQLAELQMQTAESRDQWMAAFRSNEAVLRADAGQTDIRRQQVDVCFRLGRFQEAREHLEELLQANDKDGALHMLLGLACEEDRKYREAVAEYGLAVEDDDFRSVETLDQKWTVFQAYANRARILHEELNDPRRAGRVCRELLKKYPSSPEAFLIRAHHHNRVGSTTLAVDDARKAVELDPDNAEALMLAAQLTLADPHSSQDDVGSVGDLLSAVTGEVRDDSRLYILLAQFERRRGDMEKAITTLKEGIERATDNQGLTSLLISQLISLGRIDEARATLAEKEEPPDSKNDPDSLYLEGGIFLREGQPAKALKRLQEARTRAVTDSQLYQLASVRIGRCWLALDRPHQALEVFNAVVRVNPSSVEAQTGLATALASTGQPVAALHVRRQLPVENLPAALQLARLELRAVMAQLPNDRDFQPVETALQAADEFDAESNEVSLIRAMMLTADGKREEARQELHSAASRRPVDVRVIGAQVQMALADRDTELAQSLLDHAGTHLTDNPELDRYQLSVWKETDPRRFKVALQEFETKEYPATAENRFRLLESIAVWHREVGNARRELMALLKAAESRGNDVDSWLRMLKPALDLKLLDVRDRVMTEMQSLAGDNDVRVRYAKAVVLVHDSQADPTSPKRAEAHRLLEEIVEERSDWSPPYVLLGQMHLRDNQRGKAAEWYRLAVLHGNRQPAILRLTSRLLVDQMRPQEAIQLFEDIRGSATGRMRTMTTELIGQIFASQGKGSDTLQLVRDDVASGIAGSMDRFMKGQMLYMSGAYDAAEAEFRGAVEEEPSEAGGWLALAGFLMRRGDQAAAADVVTEAEARLIDADNPVALARCFELVGRTEDAEQHLASALRVEPENGAVRLALASFFVRFKRWSEARKLIDPMLETPDQFPGTDRLAVRRLKVRTIAFTSFAGFKKSLELLQANIDEAVDRSTDQRIRARLLASHTQLEFVRQGLDLYSVVERKVALTAPEKLVVARAYDRLHAEKTADDRWQSLLNDHSRQPGVVEAYVVRQLKRGHPEGLQKHI